MKRIFIETTVLTYATGGAHPAQESCRRLVDAAGSGEVELHASTEAIQEFLHHRMRRGSRAEAIAEARVAAATCHLHPFDEEVLSQSLSLVATTTIRGRDAVHAATAITNGFDHVISADSDFDNLPGLRRIDPADALS